MPEGRPQSANPLFSRCAALCANPEVHLWPGRSWGGASASWVPDAEV
jgi:hypothetical protein